MNSPKRVSRKRRNQEQRKKRELTPVTVALYNAGSSPSEVARQAGVGMSTVTKVMLGQSRSAKIEKLIEAITGQPWDKLRAA